MAAASQSASSKIGGSCGRRLKKLAEVGSDEILAAAAGLWRRARKPLSRRC